MSVNILRICRNFLYQLSLQSKPTASPRILSMAAKASIMEKLQSLIKNTAEITRLMDILTSETKSLEAELQRELGIVTDQLAQPSTCQCFASGSKFSDRTDGTHVTAENSDAPPPKRQKTDFTTTDGFVVVYADGACENNGKPTAKAGIGAWFGENHPHNVSKPVEGRATNNVAEIQACIAAVQVAKENGIKKLRIITDSQFCINAMTKWIHAWKKKGWKLANGKSDVKNKEEFQKLDSVRAGIEIDWVHVAGHTGVHGNEMADLLAREGAKNYKAN